MDENLLPEPSYPHLDPFLVSGSTGFEQSKNLRFGVQWTLPGISPESQSKSSHGHPAEQLSSQGQFC